jgi:ElaB/YqjD/DUF883 family membrane-anchored ribosome-binding protein
MSPAEFKRLADNANDKLDKALAAITSASCDSSDCSEPFVESEPYAIVQPTKKETRRVFHNIAHNIKGSLDKAASILDKKASVREAAT